MKKYYLIYTVTFLLPISAVFAQVGVDTENPQGIFHLDPKKDTNGTTNVSDDFVVSDSGQVGIGTVSPATNQKLHIAGDSKISGNAYKQGDAIVEGYGQVNKIGISVNAPTYPIHISASDPDKLFRLSDTSESPGYLLTSDTNGYAYWEALKPMSSIVRGVLNTEITINDDNNGIDITRTRLKLAAGKWFIFARAATQGNIGGFAMYIQLFSDENSSSAIARTAGYAQPSSPYPTIINLAYVVDIPYNSSKPFTEYWIQLSSSSNNGVTTNNFGPMSFYALRIDRDQ